MTENEQPQVEQPKLSTKHVDPAVYVLIHLVSDTLLVGEVEEFSSKFLILKTPLTLVVTYSEEDASVESFYLEPHLYPFSVFNENTRVPFNLDTIQSMMPPQERVLSAYLDTVKRIFNKVHAQPEVSESTKSTLENAPDNDYDDATDAAMQMLLSAYKPVSGKTIH